MGDILVARDIVLVTENCLVTLVDVDHFVAFDFVSAKFIPTDYITAHLAALTAAAVAVDPSQSFLSSSR